ncbi:PTS ascorbate transporter subunit IIC [uncultured Limosilactobacillus sp.]|uniref:PTS ascorbate transporter subunit IIC n=1 Tax=uncultured Limosilactobacillus sp. TaxID=2837629 RepID=UPI0025EFE768|nr:PTS ascorbate transporter subunit IIC [uncultured Limosilactobacillus sp.]
MKFVVALLSNPAILLGLVACIGLIAQKGKTATDVVKGTIKTIVGFAIFQGGGAMITASLQNFNKLFQKGFHIHGVIAAPEAATAAAQTHYGLVVSVVLILGFVFNLIFARITPFKNIFFTGGHSLFFACVLGLILKSYGMNDFWACLLGGAILGFFSGALPELCQPFMRRITGGDQQAIGHFNMIGYALAGCVGLLFKKHADETTENIHFPKFLSLFKDFIIGVAVLMLILFYAATLAAGEVYTMKVSGGIQWLVFPLLQAISFTAGMSILMYGVGMFLEELTNAFVSISTKFIPGSRPALDVPTIFPYAPTAILVGFISSYTAGLIAIVIMLALHFSTVIIPAAHICFFSGGASAIFGNSTGGWRGAIAGSFVMGLLLAFLPLVLMPTFQHMGINGSTFPNVDYNVIGIFLKGVLNLF